MGLLLVGLGLDLAEVLGLAITNEGNLLVLASVQDRRHSTKVAFEAQLRAVIELEVPATRTVMGIHFSL